MNTQINGIVLWWDERDGYGIIVDCSNNEWYFDRSVLVKTYTPKRNEQVLFEKNYKIKDVKCARNVINVEN